MQCRIEIADFTNAIGAEIYATMKNNGTPKTEKDVKRNISSVAFLDNI